MTPTISPTTSASPKRARPRLRALATAVTVALLALGCSSADHGMSPNDTSATSQSAIDLEEKALDASVILQPNATKAVENTTVQVASYFLHQASFGPNAANISAMQRVGFSGWLNAELAKPYTPLLPSVVAEAEKFAADTSIDTPKAIGRLGLNGATGDVLWRNMISADDQLRQRVAFALSQIFVVSNANNSVRNHSFAMADYYDTLGRHAFGNYRTLLEAVSRHPAMGFYLNAKGNKKADPKTGAVPDENYAREVMQLFSIGLIQLNADGTPKYDSLGNTIPTYTNDDVMGLARVFTGLSWGNGDTSTKQYNANGVWVRNSTTMRPIAEALAFQTTPMKVYPQFHETAEKRFLGTQIAANADGNLSLKVALDTLASHPNTGPFICKQLIQRLVTSNPSKAYVRDVVGVFNNNGKGVRGDLGAVVRRILTHPEARAYEAARASDRVGKLREPVQRITNWARLTEAKPVDGKWNAIDLGAGDVTVVTGQRPLESPSVFNFFRPGYTPPGSAAAAAGLLGPEFQITDETTVAGWANLVNRLITNSSPVKSDYAALLKLSADPAGLLNHLNIVLTGGMMTTDTQTLILKRLQAIDASKDAGKLQRVRAALQMVMLSPEYAVQR